MLTFPITYLFPYTFCCRDQIAIVIIQQIKTGEVEYMFHLFQIIFSGSYSLLQRRQTSRLKLFYKAVHFAKIPDYYNQETLMQSTRSYHPLHFTIPFINTNSYKFSYFSRTIEDWNHLPHHLIGLETVDLFVINVMHVSSYIANHNVCINS